MKTILAFILLTTSLCAASSFSSGGCRSVSFSSTRSMSLSSTRMSSTSFSKVSSSSSSGIKASSVKFSSTSYSRPSSYSYRSFAYRPMSYSGIYTPYYCPIYSTYSPLNNMWFWMYMMHNNNSVFNHHNSLENWDGNSDQTDNTNSNNDDKTVEWVLIGCAVFIAVIFLIFIFNLT